MIENNQLVVANPHYAFDLEQAEQSLKIIKDYNVSTWICYHGGVLKDN